MRRPTLALFGLLVAILAGLAATAMLAQPPALRTANEPGQFDAARAKARLAEILGEQRPHPADSDASDGVRERLVGQIRALGLTPIVRDQFACNTIYKQRGVTCARVRNVIVALGPKDGKALLLNSHYDSNPSGPGAGDAGVGVATMLEVASILKSERLRRPVILLFNEGEELGLVGARAFLSDPMSSRVHSLINLEARGTTGPVSMFETSIPNGLPVRAYAKAVDRPVANSLATDFYRQLPNYTDVNSFAERGWATLNFAMVGNETRYHSAGDNLAALDLRSVQHMGDQALAVTRELANGAPGGGGSLLFADIAGRQLVMMPQWLGFALLLVLVAGFAIVAYRRGGLWPGLAVFVAALAGSLALAWAGLFVVGELRPGQYWRGYPIWTQLAVNASALVAAVAALVLVARRLAPAQLRASYWLGYALLGVAVLLIAPGGVIYFLAPPLVALAGILLSRLLPWAERAGAVLAAILLWLTLGEVTALLAELLNGGPLVVFAPLAAILAMPWLIEAKALVDKARRRPAVGAATALMLAGWAAAAAAPAYSADRQQRFTIQHVTDVTGKKAYWSVINDRAPLPAGFGGVDGWRWAALPYGERKRWVAPAAPLPGTAPPQIRLVGMSSANGLRTVAFRIATNGAGGVALVADEDAQIVSAGSGGFVRPFAGDTDGEYGISCVGRSCDGATMLFTTRSARPLELTLVGWRGGLFASAGPLVEQRPRFARPQYAPDTTMTLSRIRL